MKKFTSYDKLSKNKKRELNQKKRSLWGAKSPITRKSKNLKAYDRKKAQHEKDDSFNAELLKFHVDKKHYMLYS